MKQKTLKGSFSLCGKGLHTGLSLTVTFNPAPENHGYKIQRIDLDGMPTIDAIAENVIDTQRGTVLGRGDDFRVSTVEHGLSALYALGIDNCLIQVNGPEFPILDGSAIQYVEKIFPETDITASGVPSGKRLVLFPRKAQVRCLVNFTRYNRISADDIRLSVSVDSLLTMAILIIVLSMGAPGMPGGGIICLSVLLEQLHVPTEAVTLVMGIGPILGMFLCMSNCTGDVAVSVAVARKEKMLDMDTYRV